MNKKKMHWGLGLAVIIFLSWWGFQRWQDEQIFRKLQTGGEKALTAGDWERLPDILTKKYAADTYGSTTPEGTLGMFVDALKKGDADLAAKYFIPEKQATQKKIFENWIKLKKNAEIADRYSQAKDGSENIPGYYILNIYEKDGVNMQIILLKNNYSGKWKIQSL